MTEDAILRELKRLADGQQAMNTSLTTLIAQVASDVAEGAGRQRQIDRLNGEMVSKLSREEFRDWRDTQRKWQIGIFLAAAAAGINAMVDWIKGA